ncbi:MAG: AAA family ATPase, partial [Chloroflexota bacterium]|nr:AAA family ATPase [Chloroflexota bacterium]
MTEQWSARPVVLRGPHLVVLVGAAGAGKSTFAARHFLPTQIVSTDRCRALVGDREDVQAFSKQAFELFYFLIEKRMELDKLIVADSTALEASVRQHLLGLARVHGYPAVAIVFTAGLELRRARNVGRERKVPDDVLVRQQAALEAALPEMRREGWDEVYCLAPEDADGVEVLQVSAGVYSPVPPPYDVVGDVHGCYAELTEILDRLGWQPDGDSYSHPEGRTLVSLGDVADRGPDVPACFRLLLRMLKEGKALFVPGNHDDKLVRYLKGRRVQVAHGLEQSISQLQALPEP